MTHRLPASLLDFIALFNRRAFWESHEALEASWRRNRSDFYQALILYASAFVHAQRRNAHGVAAQLDKAMRLLAPYRPSYLGLDVAVLLGHAEACRRAVATHSDVAPVEWSRLLPLRLEPDLALVRGDEMELRDSPSDAAVRE
jgi:uncharacterized protein